MVTSLLYVIMTKRRRQKKIVDCSLNGLKFGYWRKRRILRKIHNFTEHYFDGAEENIVDSCEN